MDERLPQELIDAWLDGGLRGQDQARFERLLSDEPDFRLAVDRLRAIDSALKRIAAPPDSARLAAIADDALGRTRGEAAHPGTGVRAWRPRRLLAAAAALAAGLAGTYLVLDTVRSRWGGPAYVTPPMVTLDIVYRAEVARGLVPLWRCDTDREFARAFVERFGEPLLLAPLPEGIEALGIGYCHCLTPRTTYVLANVRGTPVVVFVDRIESDAAQAAPPGLNLFRRQVGNLVLYEMTPLPEPSLLEEFYHPKKGT